MPRPLFSHSTQELAAEFERRRDDVPFLRKLTHELAHRERPAAVALLARVSTRLTELAGSDEPESVPAAQVSSTRTSTPSAPAPLPAPIPDLPPSAFRRIQGVPASLLKHVPALPALERATFASRPAGAKHKAEIGILDAWTTLEVLSPPAYRRPEQLAGGDRKAVAELDGARLPWEGEGERPRPQTRLYYQVVLGSVSLEHAVGGLLEAFGDSRIERPAASGRAILASATVDRTGRPVESPAVGISSFGWAVPRALTGKLNTLAVWSDAEAALVDGLERCVRRTDDEGELLPLTREVIQEAFDWLVSTLGITREWVEAPSFAIRSYQYFLNQDPPEPLLLNSFFLNDLAAARRQAVAGRLPPLLRRYLGSEAPAGTVDLLEDTATLARALAPRQMPPARWPARAGAGLVVLQQAAVNLALHELADGGLLGINGPPGTGKTTLLRDLVASVLTSRAEAMLAFDEPAKAFRSSGMKLRSGQGGWTHLYHLDSRLRGFEMVVASSNNKVVENVSAELPGAGAVDPGVEGLRYFRSLSDALAGKETWGLVAAVLGNAANRGRFAKLFWWDRDVGMSAYLAAAGGTPQVVEAVDERTGERVERPPRIVTEEGAPTTPARALDAWKKARQRFQKALAASRNALLVLEGARRVMATLPSLERDEAAARATLATACATLTDAERTASAAAERSGQLQEAISRVRAVELERWSQDHAQRKGEVWRRLEWERGQLSRVRAEVEEHERARPGLVGRMFTEAGKSWAESYERLRRERGRLEGEVKTLSREAALLARETEPPEGSEVVQARGDAAAARRAQSEAEAAVVRLRSSVQQAEQGVAAAGASWRSVRAEVERLRGEIGNGLVDDAFLRQGHEDLQRSVAWLGEAEQQLRGELFAAAVQLHKAFVDAAARPLRHNLSALMRGFGRGLPKEKRAVLPDLWSSLFLVVPLVSTTFASVERMLGLLPEGSLGWLLVDEAGQALPQAAVGALARVQRALVVGDPIQVEPVVVLPDSLTARICQHFSADPDRFNPPGASVQTLGDAASPYVAEFPTRDGSRTVGMPLLVHRRCAEPMFGISNAAAYARLMVQAKAPAPSAIREVLGASAWLDVRSGAGFDKWSEEEGAAALALLARLRAAGVSPDLYLVTPFVVVADNLRELIRRRSLLPGCVDDPYRWTEERVGTVHTVQGREAEGVIFVLGAPHPQQVGARRWVGGRPNLLNVAVTRAKECLYVVGNRSLWREVGVFAELDRRLP